MYFEVVREAGPPHMRTFLTKVIVGDFVTEGEGNGKKVESGCFTSLSFGSSQGCNSVNIGLKSTSRTIFDN